MATKKKISPASRKASRAAPHISYSAQDIANLIYQYNKDQDHKGTVAGWIAFLAEQTKGNEFPLTKAWLSDPDNMQRFKLKMNSLRKVLKTKTTESEWAEVNRNLTFPRGGRAGRTSTTEQAHNVLSFMGIGTS